MNKQTSAPEMTIFDAVRYLTQLDKLLVKYPYPHPTTKESEDGGFVHQLPSTFVKNCPRETDLLTENFIHNWDLMPRRNLLYIPLMTQLGEQCNHFNLLKASPLQCVLDRLTYEQRNTLFDPCHPASRAATSEVLAKVNKFEQYREYTAILSAFLNEDKQGDTRDHNPAVDSNQENRANKKSESKQTIQAKQYAAILQNEFGQEIEFQKLEKSVNLESETPSCETQNGDTARTNENEKKVQRIQRAKRIQLLYLLRQTFRQTDIREKQDNIDITQPATRGRNVKNLLEVLTKNETDVCTELMLTDPYDISPLRDPKGIANQCKQFQENQTTPPKLTQPQIDNIINYARFNDLKPFLQMTDDNPNRDKSMLRELFTYVVDGIVPPKTEAKPGQQFKARSYVNNSGFPADRQTYLDNYVALMQSGGSYEKNNELLRHVAKMRFKKALIKRTCQAEQMFSALKTHMSASGKVSSKKDKNQFEQRVAEFLENWWMPLWLSENNDPANTVFERFALRMLFHDLINQCQWEVQTRKQIIAIPDSSPPSMQDDDDFDYLFETNDDDNYEKTKSRWAKFVNLLNTLMKKRNGFELGSDEQGADKILFKQVLAMVLFMIAAEQLDMPNVMPSLSDENFLTICLNVVRGIDYEKVTVGAGMKSNKGNRSLFPNFKTLFERHCQTFCFHNDGSGIDGFSAASCLTLPYPVRLYLIERFKRETYRFIGSLDTYLEDIEREMEVYQAAAKFLKNKIEHNFTHFGNICQSGHK